jgi:hypothetical protein
VEINGFTDIQFLFNLLEKFSIEILQDYLSERQKRDFLLEKRRSVKKKEE